MPIIQSAKKQLRQNKTRKARNDFFRAAYREARKAFEKAIESKDKKSAKAIFENKKNKEGVNIKA
jgi:ribosomal protein S20